LSTCRRYDVLVRDPGSGRSCRARPGRSR
jgi:hypothetical protein